MQAQGEPEGPPWVPPCGCIMECTSPDRLKLPFGILLENVKDNKW